MRFSKKRAIEELVQENIKSFIIEETQTEYLSVELEKLPEGENKSATLRRLSELEQIMAQRRAHQEILKRKLKEINNKEGVN